MQRILQRQILPFFEMISEILERTDDELFVKSIGKYQYWKMIYHPVYWFHFHLSDKQYFVPAPFHTMNMQSWDVHTNTPPSKD